MPTSIVIVGGGAGGVELAAALGRRFGRTTMSVTLVDCAPHHLWKPRLHEVAAGLLGSGEDEISYLSLTRPNYFRFRLGAMIGLDATAKTITLDAVKDSQGGELLGQRSISYDKLVLAFGSQVNDFGIEGVAQHCHVLDSGDQALQLQRHLLEAAVRVGDGQIDRLSVGIVGAGATGVELAAELHHAVRALQRFGGMMPLDRLDITLVDMAPRVLSNNAESTSAFALKTLERFGVRVKLNAGVERVAAEGLFLKGGDFVPCILKVWASGIIGRPLAATLSGLSVDRSRRLVCNPDLSCQGVKDIFAMGDCALVVDPKTKRPVPATAQVAHQQASYLVNRLARTPAGATPRPFTYRPMGSLVSLGTAPAAGEFPSRKGRAVTFRGLTPKLFYTMLQLMHRAALIGWVRAVVLAAADRLRRTSAPVIKLH